MTLGSEPDIDLVVLPALVSSVPANVGIEENTTCNPDPLTSCPQALMSLLVALRLWLSLTPGQQHVSPGALPGRLCGFWGKPSSERQWPSAGWMLLLPV